MPSPGLLLVANKLGNTVSIIDLAAEREIAKVPVTGINPAEVDASPREIAVAPDGRTAWLPIFSDAGVGDEGTDGRSITLVSLCERKAIGYVDLGKPMRPHTIVLGPDRRFYVTTEYENSITVIDPKTRKVVRSLPTGESQSHELIFSHDGKRIYTCNVGPGSISVIDGKSGKLLPKIAVHTPINRLALTLDDRYLLTNDQVEPRVIMIDTRTRQTVKSIRTPGVPYGLALSPDGRWLLCTIPMIGEVGVIDTSTWEVVTTVHTPRMPQFVLFRPDGQEAYVSTGFTNWVGIIDVKGWRVRKFIRAGPDADGLAWVPAVQGRALAAGIRE